MVNTEQWWSMQSNGGKIEPPEGSFRGVRRAGSKVGHLRNSPRATRAVTIASCSLNCQGHHCPCYSLVLIMFGFR